LKAYARGEYRPDIDGLRAIAVLAVLGFHAQFGPLRGGFIGVDIFFVISGYLISGIIFRELDDASFSFARFYTRRINRIFPALLAVLLFVAVVGWATLFSTEFALLGKHILGGAAFFSNAILWREAGYFDSSQKPLLHLWSLAVEEQFYLIWPLLTSVAWQLKRRQGLAVLLLVVGGFSFIANVFAVSHSMGTAAFYSPITRFWQILSGAGLAYAELRSENALLKIRRSFFLSPGVLATLGLGLLLLGFCLVRPTTPWPGWYGLLPVSGSLLLLTSGPHTWINKRILANRRLVAVGLISYPLYLWHWPLIVFAQLLNGEPLRRSQMVVILASAFALAALTYGWIERPIRFGNHKQRSAIALIPLMGCFALMGFIAYRQMIPPRSGQTAAAIAEATTDWSYPGDGALTGLRRDVVVDTIHGDTSNTVAFLGDSHIQQYWPRVNHWRGQTKNPPQVLFFTYGSCPPWPDVNRNAISPLTGSDFECNVFHRKVIEQLLASSNIRKIVIGAYWEIYLSEGLTFSTLDPKRTPLRMYGAWTDSAFFGFEQELLRLHRAGKRVYILLSNPTGIAYNPRSMLANRLRDRDQKKPALKISKQEFLSRSVPTTGRIRNIAKRVGAIVIDPVDYMCGATSCPTVSTDGKPIYTDEQHLRATYARDFAAFIDSVFK
jgi:peptidoglycan/LPS O-acetylase OafA/YrhL